MVVDRLSNSVYRYSESGALLGTVVDHSLDIYLPTGIGMSPDGKQLYVSSSQRNRVMRYDYNAATGAATNPTIFADPSDELAYPNDIQFSPDGSVIYVSNLNGGISRFLTNGDSAGPKLMLPTTDDEIPTPASSLNFTSSGALLAGAFQDPTGALGGIALSNAARSAFPEMLVEPTPDIRGATGLMIHDDYLYVSGLFSGKIRRFALSNGTGIAAGQMDTSWGISGLAYPQDLMLAPDGNGFLAGILGFANGAGNISRYSFDGTLLGMFADHGNGGFTEATAFVAVPTPIVGLVGDFNNDGVVDAADYITWRNAAPTDTLPNDDSPGTVNASDYADWRANFGLSQPGSSAAYAAGVVPEPASVVMLLGILLAGSVVRNRI